MTSSFTRIRSGKREWRAMEARADALPRDHRIVYREMSCHQLLRGTTSYPDRWQASLNGSRASLDRDVARRLAD